MKFVGRWHALYPVVMIGLLAALTLWLNRAMNFEPVRQDGKLRHDPDYFVDNLNGKRFDDKANYNIRWWPITWCITPTTSRPS